ncbi:MAG: glyceraldehyde dehydrogenase subunit beta [Thermoproteus sp.]
MIPPPFDYVRASSIDEAVKALSEDPNAKVLAGGQSLIPLLKLRAVAPSKLVDIGRLKELRYVRQTGDGLAIGALATHAELERWSGPCGILPEAARQIGDPQIRSVGTIGGSLAHADPAADWPAVVLALDAVVKARGPSGVREIPAEEFFQGPYSTALQQGEIVVEISIPRCPPKASYVKIARAYNDFAIAGVAAAVWVKDGAVEDVRLAATGVGLRPVRLRKAEEAVRGRKISGDLLAEVAEAASKEVEPVSDVRASAEYRRAMAGVAARRAVRRALGL